MLIKEKIIAMLTAKKLHDRQDDARMCRAILEKGAFAGLYLSAMSPKNDSKATIRVARNVPYERQFRNHSISQGPVVIKGGFETSLPVAQLMIMPGSVRHTHSHAHDQTQK